MKKNIFFLVLLCSGSIVQCMNLPSALHTLENKLTHFRKFLTPKEPTAVSNLLNEFESRVQAMQNNALKLDTDFNDLFALQLKNIPLDSSGNAIPTNEIAQQFSAKAKQAFNTYTELASNFDPSANIFKEIGNNFTKDQLTQSEKTRFVSILTKFQDYLKTLKKIHKKLEAVIASGALGYTKGLMINLDSINFSISKINSIFFSMSISFNNIIPTIKQLIETNNLDLVENDIQNITHIQQNIQEGLSPFLKSTKLEKETLNAILNAIQKWGLDLALALHKVENYGFFIKDSNLKQKLLIAMPNQNYYQNLRDKIEKFPQNTPEKNSILTKLSFLIKRIQEVTSVVKS